MPAERLLLVCGIAMAALSLSSHAQPRNVGAVEVNDKLISVSGNGHQRSFPCNGRKLEVLLSQMGPTLLRLYRQERAKKAKT